MPFECPNLPFRYDALEPVIAQRTLEIHHGRHHGAYVDKVNALVAETGLAGDSLEAVIQVSRSA